MVADPYLLFTPVHKVNSERLYRARDSYLRRYITQWKEKVKRISFLPPAFISFHNLWLFFLNIDFIFLFNSLFTTPSSIVPLIRKKEVSVETLVSWKVHSLFPPIVSAEKALKLASKTKLKETIGNRVQSTLIDRAFELSSWGLMQFLEGTLL